MIYVTLKLTFGLDHAIGDPSGVCNIKYSIQNLIKDAKDIIQTSWLISVWKKYSGNTKIPTLDCKLYHVMVSLSDRCLFDVLPRTLLLWISLLKLLRHCCCSPVDLTTNLTAACCPESAHFQVQWMLQCYNVCLFCTLFYGDFVIGKHTCLCKQTY